MKNIKTYNEFEPLNEGRYDSITNKISSDIFNQWKKDFYEGKTKSTYSERYETKDIINGSDVHKYYWSGRIEEIKEYCEKDVSSSIDAGLKLYN